MKREILTKDTIHIVKHIVNTDHEYYLYSDGSVKLYSLIEGITTNGYIEIEKYSILKDKDVKNIQATNVYVSGSISVGAQVTAQQISKSSPTITIYFRRNGEAINNTHVRCYLVMLA